MTSSRPLALTFAAVLSFSLAGSLAAPSAPAPAPLAAPSVLEAFGVPQAGQELLELADRVGGTSGAAAALQAAGLWEARPAPTASPDLATALARLGEPGAPDGFLAGLDEATSRALAPLVDATADAGALVDLAFARLSPAERDSVLRQAVALGDPGASDEQREAARLAGLVDPVPLRAAAHGLLAAAEGFLAAQPAAAPSSPVPPGPTGLPGPASLAVGAAAAGACGAAGFSLVSPGGLVEIGFTGANSYFQERVLIVDLGGDDCYENYPATYGPGTPLTVPVSAIVDVGGNDLYVTTTAHPLPSPLGTTWSAGVGIGGIGLLVDRWGDDTYFAALNNEPPNCNAYGGYPTGDSWQRVYAQGVGILGVGGLADLGGNDRYQATNLNNLPDPFCPWGRVYTYAQGTAARVGLGFLVDDTGNERYFADAYAAGKQRNNAHAHAQATAAGRGVAALIDKEGDDSYDARSDALLGPAPWSHYYADASTFAQASLYGANEPRAEAVVIDPPCEEILPTTVEVCRTIDRNPVVVGLDLCTSASTPQAGKAGVPCDLPAYALLVDVLGQDRYDAWSGTSSDDQTCHEGSWATTAAQGSAPAKGVAALVDAALDTDNTFKALSSAWALGCEGLGVRGMTASQGFGGAFLWDFYDAPPFDPLLFTDLSVGLLARGGFCGLDLNVQVPIAIQVDTNDPCPAAWADDVYEADATATNAAGFGLSWAQARAQGSGNGFLQVPAGPWDALGVGGHIDLFGDDDFSATAHANGGGAVVRDPMVVAQAAATSAVGVLVNVGDVDDYHAMAFNPGPVPIVPFWTLPWIVAQADATVDNPVTVSFCVGIVCSRNTVSFAAAVLVDQWGGPADTYNLAPFCPNNGGFPLAPGPYIWGNTLPSPCGVNNPAALPPPGSNGMILGIDW